MTRIRNGRHEFDSQHRWRRVFSLCHQVQTGSGAHSASCQMNTVSSLPGKIRPKRVAVYPPPCSAEIKNVWSNASTLPCIFTLWCLIKHRTRLYEVVLGKARRQLNLTYSQNSKNYVLFSYFMTLICQPCKWGRDMSL